MNSKFTQHGGVIPDGCNPIYSSGRQEQKFGVFRGHVKDVVYPDDKDRNLSGGLEYIVTVLGQDYYGVRDITLGGGIFNGGVRVRAVDEAPKPLGVRPGGYEQERDGEFVWVLFIGGNTDFPMIIGSDHHPRDIENEQRPPLTKADGLVCGFEYNGVYFKIDKDSNFTIEHLGRKNAIAATVAAVYGTPMNIPPVIANPEAVILPFGPTKFKFAGNGDVEFVISETPEFSLKFIKASQKWDLKAGLGLSLTFDGTGDEFKAVTASGAEISASLANGIKLSDPTGTSLSMKAGAVEMAGTLGKLKLSGGKVGMGSPAAEVVDLLEQTITQMDSLLTALQAETHIGNLGYPTSPPVNLASYTAIQGLLAAVKLLVTSIKGGV